MGSASNAGLLVEGETMRLLILVMVEVVVGCGRNEAAEELGTREQALITFTQAGSLQMLDGPIGSAEGAAYAIDGGSMSAGVVFDGLGWPIVIPVNSPPGLTERPAPAGIVDGGVCESLFFKAEGAVHFATADVTNCVVDRSDWVPVPMPANTSRLVAVSRNVGPHPFSYQWAVFGNSSGSLVTQVGAGSPTSVNFLPTPIIESSVQFLNRSGPGVTRVGETLFMVACSSTNQLMMRSSSDFAATWSSWRSIQRGCYSTPSIAGEVTRTGTHLLKIVAFDQNKNIQLTQVEGSSVAPWTLLGTGFTGEPSIVRIPTNQYKVWGRRPAGGSLGTAWYGFL